jgi:hypothetical protein
MRCGGRVRTGSAAFTFFIRQFALPYQLLEARAGLRWSGTDSF